MTNTQTLVAISETPVVAVTRIPARGRWRKQGADESFAAYQLRISDAQQKDAERKRTRYATAKRNVAIKAHGYLVDTAGTSLHDIELAVKQALDSEGMIHNPEVVSIPDAFSAVQRIVTNPEKQTQITRQGLGILDTFVQDHLKGFSRPQNKTRSFVPFSKEDGTPSPELRVSGLKRKSKPFATAVFQASEYETFWRGTKRSNSDWRIVRENVVLPRSGRADRTVYDSIPPGNRTITTNAERMDGCSTLYNNFDPAAPFNCDPRPFGIGKHPSDAALKAQYHREAKRDHTFRTGYRLNVHDELKMDAFTSRLNCTVSTTFIQSTLEDGMDKRDRNAITLNIELQSNGKGRKEEVFPPTAFCIAVTARAGLANSTKWFNRPNAVIPVPAKVERWSSLNL